MRETKFRGMTEGRLKTWVYGSYQADVMSNGIHTIIYSDFNGYYCEDEVNAETVGQYTGGKDKNGVDVWEGDIVKFERDTYLRGGGYRRNTYFSPVKYENDYCAFLANYIDDEGEELTITLDKFSLEKIEVVGNIHENAELLTT